MCVQAMEFSVQNVRICCRFLVKAIEIDMTTAPTRFLDFAFEAYQFTITNVRFNMINGHMWQFSVLRIFPPPFSECFWHFLQPPGGLKG